MNTHAIILARGGSKSIPKKNIIEFCGKPLIAWTIEHCIFSKYVNKVWVSSDNKDILNISKNYGAEIILRPKIISGDNSSSEEAWLHAIDVIKERFKLDLIVAPQVTSPLREVNDIDNGIKLLKKNNYDSLFSASLVNDLFFWHNTKNGLSSINYNFHNRRRRQDIDEQIIENGSFYLFKPALIKKHNNRLNGKIGYSVMDYWKMFEIDDLEDLRICSALMKEFIL